MRILFGVNGEGMGHAVRSKAIITELEKEHNVLVVAGGKAYPFLKKTFKISKIGYMNIIYRNNGVIYFETLLYNLLKFPLIFLWNLKLIAIMLMFKPHVVITDLEPFSCYATILFGKKCISIDNQHITNADDYDKSILESIFMRFMIPWADYYLVTTFFYPKVIKKDTYLFPPINREEIIKTKPKKGNFILVYQTSKSNRKLIPALRKINENFVLYGLNKDKTLGNIRLKKFNEKEFVSDMAKCSAVISNGGFTVIGEALYLNKPVLSVPVKKQFEQIRNAHYLEILGYGKYCKEINEKEVKEFISNLAEYKRNLRAYKKEDNTKVIKKLKELINSKLFKQRGLIS